jgi:hypothetical protein
MREKNRPDDSSLKLSYHAHSFCESSCSRANWTLQVAKQAYWKLHRIDPFWPGSFRFPHLRTTTLWCDAMTQRFPRSVVVKVSGERE